MRLESNEALTALLMEITFYAMDKSIVCERQHCEHRRQAFTPNAANISEHLIFCDNSSEINSRQTKY